MVVGMKPFSFSRFTAFLSLFSQKQIDFSLLDMDIPHARAKFQSSTTLTARVMALFVPRRLTGATILTSFALTTECYRDTVKFTPFFSFLALPRLQIDLYKCQIDPILCKISRRIVSDGSRKPYIYS